MGSLLEIIGSHKLKFNSGEDVVNQFQSIFNVKIKNGNYQSNEVKNKHENPNQIEYFVALDYLEQNFIRWKEVRIMTNFKFCSEINIHGKTLSFNNGCRYKYWKGNLFEEEYQEDLKRQYALCKTYWKEVHKFSKKTTKRLGGEMQIYFEDSRFQEEIDLCFQGNSLNYVFDAMKEKWEPTEIDDARKRKDEFLVKNGWYFEKMNTT
ncbi:hypothetical protein [Lewinella sp. W8]|uniref:hypothetical protein n=1 Tax=Lewinella sp. W8 TaxID=2528208 RepID=UPI001067A75F|nr:hypothetical protein [Lewinella sp. W8]MTB51693.1 hypothetical protein [Lewinella sp. W8]